MDFTAEREEATIATLLANLTTVCMNTISQKNQIIKELQSQLENLKERPSLEDK